MGKRASKVVRLEDICFNAKETVRSMFEFVQLEFSYEYLDLRSKRFGIHQALRSVSTPCMHHD